jgi:hypothetical protein
LRNVKIRGDRSPGKARVLTSNCNPSSRAVVKFTNLLVLNCNQIPNGFLSLSDWQCRQGLARFTGWRAALGLGMLATKPLETRHDEDTQEMDVVRKQGLFRGAVLTMRNFLFWELSLSQVTVSDNINERLQNHIHFPSTTRRTRQSRSSKSCWFAVLTATLGS